MNLATVPLTLLIIVLSARTACVNCADRRATKCDATGVLACGFGLVPKGTSCACPTGQYFTGFTSESGSKL